MKKQSSKFTAALILGAFALVVYREGFWGPGDLGGEVSGLGSMAQAEQMFQELGGEVGAMPVVVFAASWCGICRALETQLSELGLAYLSVDIEKDPGARKYYSAVTGGAMSGVPVTVVGTKAFLGYQPKAIVEAILELKDKKDEPVTISRAFCESTHPLS